MKLRRPRLKRALGWASFLVGATIVAAGVAAHLETAPGPPRFGSVWIAQGPGGHRPGAGRMQIQGVLYTPAAAAVGPTSSRRLHLTNIAPGLSYTVLTGAAGESVSMAVYPLAGAANRAGGAPRAAHSATFIVQVREHELRVHAASGAKLFTLFVAAPWLWALGAPMVLTPACVRWRTRRRRRKGACKKCGYDLSGLPTREPCPECGV